jgi:hypothetical protein
MVDDPDASAGELIAALIEHCPPDKAEELHEAVRSLSSDSRGSRSWARDKLESRRLGKDMRRARDKRRLGRDFGPENLTEAVRRGPIEEFRSERDRQLEQGEDRCRAHDMAMDARARQDSNFAHFCRMFPGAARIERF